MSTAICYRITLARAHKLQERLNARMSKLREQVTGFRPATGFARVPTPEQAQQLREQQKGIWADVQLYEKCSHVLAGLRAAIGRANAQVGVGDVLAEIENKKRTATLLSHLQSNFKQVGVNAVHVDACADYQWPTQHDGYGSDVQFTALHPADVEVLDARIDALERDIFEAQDGLADLNATLVDIALDEPEVAEILGLAGLPGGPAGEARGIGMPERGSSGAVRFRAGQKGEK